MATTERQVHAEKEIGTDTARRTESGLDENVVGALSYVFGFVSGLIVYLLERDNPFARFHAAQSIALTGAFAVLYIALSVFGTTVTAITYTSTSAFIVGSLVSLVIGLVWLGITLGGFGLWVYLIVRTYQGNTPRVPVVASIADRLA